MTKDGKWTFGKKVPFYFEKHIKKSIPNYDESVEIIITLSTYFLNNNSVLYDVGCSTGKLIRILDKIHKGKNIKFFGIDPEKAMIDYIKSLDEYKKSKNIKLINNEVEKVKLLKSDMIISNYTMQFINFKKRKKILQKFYNSLNIGGAFLIFEKIYGNNSQFEKILSDMLIDFKIKNRFSEKQIINKNKQIKGVLNPLTLEKNLKLLSESGFKNVQIINQKINFVGILAIK